MPSSSSFVFISSPQKSASMPATTLPTPASLSPSSSTATLSSLPSFLSHQELPTFANAIEYYRSTLASHESRLGPSHPDTLSSVNNLAELLRTQSKYAEAEPLYRRALEGREQQLGAMHPDTLASVNNLALLLKARGKYLEAEPLYRRSLEGREVVFGPSHPQTLSVVINLGALFFARQGYRVAEQLFRRAVQGRELSLGPQHPQTKNALAWLHKALRALEQQSEVAEDHHFAHSPHSSPHRPILDEASSSCDCTSIPTLGTGTSAAQFPLSATALPASLPIPATDIRSRTISSPLLHTLPSTLTSSLASRATSSTCQNTSNTIPTSTINTSITITTSTNTSTTSASSAAAAAAFVDNTAERLTRARQTSSLAPSPAFMLDVPWKSHLYYLVRERNNREQNAFAEAFGAYGRAVNELHRERKKISDLDAKLGGNHRHQHHGHGHGHGIKANHTSSATYLLEQGLAKQSGNNTGQLVLSKTFAPGTEPDLGRAASSSQDSHSVLQEDGEKAGGLFGSLSYRLPQTLVSGVSTVVGTSASYLGVDNLLTNRLREMEEKNARLSEELTAAYRLGYENADAMLRLKNQSETDEKLLMDKDAELNRKDEEIHRLQIMWERQSTREKELTAAIHLLRSELKALHQELQIAQEREKESAAESAQLIERVLKLRSEKDEAVQDMAAMLELAQVCICWAVCGAMLCYALLSCVLCYAMLCYAMLCYAMLCYAMLRYAMLCYAMLCYAVLCCAMLCYAVLCYAMLCYAVICYAMLCYATLRYATLRCAVLCCAVLCCAVLCCAVLCCAVLCSAALRCAVLCCAVLCYAKVLCYAILSAMLRYTKCYATLY
eukprot:g49116.t1